MALGNPTYVLMPRILVFLAILAAAVIGAAAAQDRPTISQRGRVFVPAEITIKVNETVTIRNDDDVLHHVYVESPTFEFDSGEQPPGKPVSITFTQRGDFEVRCDIHPKMLLVVHVL